MTRRILAALFVFSLLAAACGDDSDGGGDNADRDGVIALLEGEGETPESAACFADELSDYSLEEMEAFVTSGETVGSLESDVSTAAETCAETAGEDAPEDGEAEDDAVG